jgi:hypothetical protein
VEEEDLEVMFGKLRGKYYKHYPKFGEGHGLEKVEISMSFSGMRETGTTRFSQLFSEAGAYTNGLRKCIDFLSYSTTEVGWEML